MDETKTPQVIDLCYLSQTFPKLPEVIVDRDLYLNYIDQQFERYDVVCVDGDSGVGVTTLLSLFAKRHNYNCVSYFNAGFSKILLSPNVIEQSLCEQLYFYAYSDLMKQVGNMEVSTMYWDILRKIGRSSQPLFFVFDGFSNLSKEVIGNLKVLFEKLLWKNVKFLFSGTVEGVKEFMSDRLLFAQSNQLFPFSESDTQNLLRHIDSDISDAEFKQIYSLTKGVAAKIDYVVKKFRLEQSWAKILDYDHAKDLYEADLRKVITSENINTKKILALVAYSEMPLTESVIKEILHIGDEEYGLGIKECDTFFVVTNDIVSFENALFHKFVRDSLSDIKQDVELLIAEHLEKQSVETQEYLYLPALYSSLNNTSALLSCLNPENIHKILISTGSQASLNEQCEYGYKACEAHSDMVLGDQFRFALNKSTFRELEKNELWDSEIEALLAVGENEKAFTLAKEVYIKEERLKSLIIIARRATNLPKEILEDIKHSIKELCSSINFKYIPDKAFELAKLLLPIDVEQALSIIDEVASVSSDASYIDKLYAIASLSVDIDKNEASSSNFDLVSSKIQDGNLKQMAHAVQSLYRECTVEDVINDLNRITSISQRLYILKFWIPAHKDQKQIGALVKYALNLVIESSNVDLPKSSLLANFCEALPYSEPEDIADVITQLDTVKDLLLMHSIDYVKIELLIIEALAKSDNDKACSRLEDLYIKILEFEDKSVELHCKAMILGKYSDLGDKQQIENKVISEVELRKEVEQQARELLKDSAYHIRVIEGPIKALIKSQPTFVRDIIPLLNTKERRCRAYLIAAIQYCLQVSVEKYNVDFLYELIKNIDYDVIDRTEPLVTMAEAVVKSSLDGDAVKRLFVKFKDFILNIEVPSDKVYVLSHLYVHLVKMKYEDSIVTFIKSELDKTWDIIDVPWLKLAVGYGLTRRFAKASVPDAEEMIQKTQKLKETSLMSSASSISAYVESLDLYSHSLGLLIRSGLCEDHHLSEFDDILARLNSESESIVTWAKIALEFKIANDENAFREICSKHVALPLDKFSLYDQKKIIYNIAPCLYLYNQQLFFNNIKDRCEGFINMTLNAVVQYILYKHAYYENIERSKTPRALEYSDYLSLLELLENITDDSIMFDIIDVMCKSLKENKDRKLSDIQKKYIIEQLELLVDKSLPSRSGIQHDGYKIACKQALAGIRTKINSASAKNTLKSQIDSINNKADVAFLYAYCSAFLQKQSDRLEFIQKSIDIANSITSSYDRTRRFDLSLDSVINYDPSRLKDYYSIVADKMLLTKGSSLSDYKRLIDIAYEYNENLADLLIEKLDNDPARISYKEKLMTYADSAKRVKGAKEDMSGIVSLNKREQKEFFSSQLSNVMSGKSITKPVEDTAIALSKIYSYPITDVKEAILFFMENLFHKNVMMQNMDGLLLQIHDSILHNLKLVLSLSNSTKEKIDRIDMAIRKKEEASASFIGIGEQRKGYEYLLSWYKEHPYSHLYVIDAYFSPSDLPLFKNILDINNDITIQVLTHKNKIESLDEFLRHWRLCTRDSIGVFDIKVVYYKDKPETGPLHDRWWICVDEDEEHKIGLTLNSIGGLGNKEGAIMPLDEGIIESILMSVWSKYVAMKPKKVDTHDIVYESISLT